MVISDLFESKVKLEATKEEMRREEDLRQSYQVLLFFWKVRVAHDNKAHRTKRIPSNSVAEFHCCLLTGALTHNTQGVFF